MVDNVIQIVTEKLSSLPCIEGIVLGGSRARGTHTEDSDIDIGIYYNSESFDLTAINQIATELDDENRNDLVVPPGAWGDWVNGGGWLVINGYHVDLILRDIKRVEQIIKDTEQGIVTANYQTGHPHGYISAMYRGELAISKIQYAKNESLCELKNQAEIYPGALKKSLINFFIFEAEFSLMFVKANAGAEDKYYIAGHVFRIISCLNQVLFACNNAYCINEKKAIKLLETFEYKPEKYAERVNHIFEVLGLSLFECYDMTEKLYKEVKKIAWVSTHEASILEDGASAHALHDAAGRRQKRRVGHPDDQIPAGVGVADPLDLDAVCAGRFPLDGGPYLSGTGDDFLREGDLPQLAREVGARRAVDAVLAVDADGADGVGAQKMAL